MTKVEKLRSLAIANRGRAIDADQDEWFFDLLASADSFVSDAEDAGLLQGIDFIREGHHAWANGATKDEEM